MTDPAADTPPATILRHGGDGAVVGTRPFRHIKCNTLHLILALTVSAVLWFSEHLADDGGEFDCFACAWGRRRVWAFTNSS